RRARLRALPGGAGARRHRRPVGARAGAGARGRRARSAARAGLAELRARPRHQPARSQHLALRTRAVTLPRTFRCSDEIQLRLLEEDDITERYVAWFRDPEVTRYLDARDISREDALAHLRQGRETGA